MSSLVVYGVSCVILTFGYCVATVTELGLGSVRDRIAVCSGTRWCGFGVFCVGCFLWGCCGLFWVCLVTLLASWVVFSFGCFRGLYDCVWWFRSWVSIIGESCLRGLLFADNDFAGLV